jgi:hypothetical protein
MYQFLSLLAVESEPIRAKSEPVTLEQVIILVAVMVSLILVVLYVVLHFRGAAFGEAAVSSNHLDDFRRLREEGKLDDEEFKKVKSKIIQPPREEVDFREDTHEGADDNDQS